MDRRQLLKHGAAAAAVAALPIALPDLLHAAAFTPVSWVESPGSAAQLNTMNPLLAKYKADPKISTLTSAEWNSLAIAHESYFTFHAQTGGLHKVDSEIKANEAYLKTKYDPVAVNYLVSYGSYALLSRESLAMRVIAGSGRQLDNNGCADFYSSVAILYAVLGIVFIAIPELVIVFFVLGLANEGMRMDLCP